MIVDPGRPASGATVCQISSVTKGISGWSMRSVASSTSTSVRRVPRLTSGAASSACRTGFESSRYQSQNSYHTNSYMACAARSKRYAAKCARAASTAAPRRPRIQRSATVYEHSPRRSAACSSVFMSTKREAFQSLLQKLR